VTGSNGFRSDELLISPRPSPIPGGGGGGGILPIPSNGISSIGLQETAVAKARRDGTLEASIEFLLFANANVCGAVSTKIHLRLSL